MTGRFLALLAALAVVGFGASFAIGKATAGGSEAPSSTPTAAAPAQPAEVELPVALDGGELTAAADTPKLRHVAKKKKSTATTTPSPSPSPSPSPTTSSGSSGSTGSSSTGTPTGSTNSNPNPNPTPTTKPKPDDTVVGGGSG